MMASAGHQQMRGFVSTRYDREQPFLDDDAIAGDIGESADSRIIEAAYQAPIRWARGPHAANLVAMSWAAASPSNAMAVGPARRESSSQRQSAAR